MPESLQARQISKFSRPSMPVLEMGQCQTKAQLLCVLQIIKSLERHPVVTMTVDMHGGVARA